MIYEAHMTSEVHTSKIPLGDFQSQDEAIKKYKRFRLAHEDQSILKLKLMKIGESGKTEEIIVP